MSGDVCRLRDGRRLGYAEYGDPAGFAVVNCHGGLACRLDVAAADGVARDAAIRLISADRPGVGLSDPKPGRTVLDWADDAEDLMEQDPPLVPIAWEYILDVWYDYVKGHNPKDYFGIYDVVRFDTFWLDKA